MSLVEERRRRIVTTHVGSLPRPPSLSAMLFARMTRQAFDATAFAGELRAGVGAIVKRQSDLGIDVVSDGEFSKTSFQYYVTDRLAGIEPITPKAGHRVTRETKAFPTFYRDGAHSGTSGRRRLRPISTPSTPPSGAPRSSTPSCRRCRRRAASA